MQKPSHVPCFWVVGKRLWPPRPSWSSKGQILTVSHQGSEEIQKQEKKKSSQETRVQQQSRVRVPPQSVYKLVPLSSSTETNVLTQVKDGLQRFLEYHSPTTPPTNQKKGTHLATLTPNFALKNSYLKTIRKFGLLSMSCPFCLLGPCHKPFSTPHSIILVYLASQCTRHVKLDSTTVF